MARASRHFLPGHIWHLTHRCHKREFLLKFSRDRNRWIELLFKAKKRYQLSILNFIVTSNHSHLIVSDSTRTDAIPRTIQFVAGRLGQEYNRRKNRKGAFWEDRYHATAIASGDHLWRCIVYVDLNMVRAGVVSHPSQWKWGGSHEIQNPKTRYRLIDHDMLKRFLNIEDQDELVKIHQGWIDSQLEGRPTRQEHFSKSIAVGSKAFVKNICHALKSQAIGRRMIELPAEGYQLRENIEKYGDVGSENLKTFNLPLSFSNSIPWR
jgi:REP element-mobilizing transposase RayT